MASLPVVRKAAHRAVAVDEEDGVTIGWADIGRAHRGPDDCHRLRVVQEGSLHWVASVGGV
jgi:hypothetical protein